MAEITRIAGGGRLEFRASWRLLAGFLGALVLLGVGSLSAQSSGRETAGLHIVRPGEDLRDIARAYLGSEETWDQLLRFNPRLDAVHRLRPGERLKVRLDSGLPGERTQVGQLAGRVEELPDPIDWTGGRRFDLLAEGDALRSFIASSFELHFADSTRLLVTEESLIFLRDAPREGVSFDHPGEVEIVEGQADLHSGPATEAEEESIEIVLGAARVQPKADDQGELGTRARRSADGTSHLMVYEGSGRVEAAGETLEVRAGQGTAIPLDGKPTPPEDLLRAPELLVPAEQAELRPGPVGFRWRGVPGAASYTLELCRDADCGELVERQTGLRATSHELTQLREGQYFWRVTATSPSGLDGWVSPSALLLLAEKRSAEGAAPTPRSLLRGVVRESLASTPLPGVAIRISGLDHQAFTDSRGVYEILLPLGNYRIEAHLPGFIVGEKQAVEVAAGTTAEASFDLDAAPMERDQLLVSPSRIALLQGETVGKMSLGREEIASLPHLGDDIFRALPLLPGVTGNDVSAELHLRGGRRDEVQVLLDGQELYDSFHLKEFDNALSVVPDAILGGVDLSSGGAPVLYGDRMSGVLDMTALDPKDRPRLQLGVSLMNLHLGAAGAWPDERGDWMVLARRGALDLAGKIFGKEDPVFWDAFATTRHLLTPRQTLWLRSLVAGDSLSFDETEEDGFFKSFRTQGDNLYLWATHQSLVGSNLILETSAAWSRVDRDRVATELDEDKFVDLDDFRQLDVTELRQTFSLQAAPRHFVTAGATWRRFDIDFDYFNLRDYESPLALAVRYPPVNGTLAWNETLTEDHVSAFLGDRWRAGENLTLELGLRYDRYTATDEDELSPRLSLAWALGESSVLRATAGRYVQSQRPYELQLADWETELHPVEISDQASLGIEHLLLGDSPFAGTSLRAEGFYRQIDDPRVRYENLYEPFNEFPELEPERFRIAATASRSQGVELLVRTPAHRRLRFWGSYTWSSVEDEIDGRDVPRSIDQTHALSLNLEWQVNESWTASMAWRYHTGWPTTPLGLMEIQAPADHEDGEDSVGEDDPEDESEDEPDESEVSAGGEELLESAWVPVLGPLNSDRLSAYHRLDLRLRRVFDLGDRGELTFFVDVQNVYNRQNLAGFEHQIDEEEGLLETVEERWPGIFPSVGIKWNF